MQHLYSEKWQLSLRERRGLLMLSAALLISVMTPLLWKKSMESTLTERYNTGPGMTQREDAAVERFTESRRPFQKKRKYAGSSTKENKHSVTAGGFSFDPNKIDAEEAGRLGIPPGVFRTIMNYRSHGGRFRKPEDLQKIYGLSASMFEKLKPWVAIPSSKTVADTSRHKTREWRFEKKPAESVKVNSASAEEWESLPGIGEKLAERIIRFREALGGFVDLHQLSEVYGLPDSTFMLIIPRLQLDNAVVRKIAINHADADELEAHPYISGKEARFLVNYRRQHHSIADLKALEETRFLTREWLEKMTPYLDFR